MTQIKNNKDIKKILLFIVIVTIGIMVTFSYLVYAEISSARNGCKDINGTYKIKNFNHACNNESFVKYTDGTWGFDIKYYSNGTIG